jgi:hypothetical protein
MCLKNKDLDNKIEASKLIIKLINEELSVDLTIPTRKRQVVVARQIAMYFIYRNLNISMQDVGTIFINKKGEPYGHATVLHAIKQIEGLSKFDRGVKNTILKLKDRVLDIAKQEVKDIEQINLLNTLRIKLKNLSFDELKQLNNQLN